MANGASPARDVRDAAEGALIGAFVGDALGMPYEGRSGQAVPDRVEMREGRAPAGSYTDDTQMMMALAESLLRCGTVDDDDLVAAFRAHFEPDRGYGSGTRTVMAMWAAGVGTQDAARRLFDGNGSPRNGAAMRVAPVAVRFFGDESRVMAEARRSAVLTHSHPEGIDGAVVQAVAVATALGGRDPLPAALAAASTQPMRRRLDELAAIADVPLCPRRLAGAEWHVPYTAVGSVPVAVTVGSRARTFEEAVTVAVRCGGDTDTVAAMAGAIAGARFGAHSLPERWYSVLEDGDFGRTHVAGLALALAEAAVCDGARQRQPPAL